MPRLYPSYPIEEDTKEGRGVKGDNAALADAVSVSRSIATRSMLRCNMSSRNPCCSAQCRAFELDPPPRALPPSPAPRRRPSPASPAPSALPHAHAHAGPSLAHARRPAPDRQGGGGGGRDRRRSRPPPRLGVLTSASAKATGMSSRLARRRCRDV